MAVTHDHSSPYYSSTAPGAWTFQDVFDVRFYDYYAKQMAKAVEQAAAQHEAGAGGRVGRLARQGAPQLDGTVGGGRRHAVRLPELRQRPRPHGGALRRHLGPGNPKPLAILLNYSLHGEFLNGNELISADCVGPMQRMVDRKSKAVTIFTQSSVGTSEPERSSYHSVHERLEFTTASTRRPSTARG